MLIAIFLIMTYTNKWNYGLVNCRFRYLTISECAVACLFGFVSLNFSALKYDTKFISVEGKFSVRKSYHNLGARKIQNFEHNHRRFQTLRTFGKRVQAVECQVFQVLSASSNEGVPTAN